MVLVAASGVPVAWWVGVAAACAVAAHGMAVALFLPRTRPALGALEALAAGAALALLGGAPIVALVVLAAGALVAVGVAVAERGADRASGLSPRRRAPAALVAVGVGSVSVVALIAAALFGAGALDRAVPVSSPSPAAVAALLTHRGAGWLAAVGLTMVLIAVAVAATEP